MRNYILKSTIAALLWVVYTLPMYAFPDPPDGTDDPLPGAPIDNWVLGLIVIALSFGVYFISKQKTTKTV